MGFRKLQEKSEKLSFLVTKKTKLQRSAIKFSDHAFDLKQFITIKTTNCN